MFAIWPLVYGVVSQVVYPDCFYLAGWWLIIGPFIFAPAPATCPSRRREFIAACVFVPGNLSLARWLISASVLAHSSGYLSLAGWFMIACVFAPAPATYPLKAGLLCVYLPLPLSSCLLRLDYYCVVFCVCVFALLLVPCRLAYCCVCLFAPAPATSSLQAGLLLCVCVCVCLPLPLSSFLWRLDYRFIVVVFLRFYLYLAGWLIVAC
jgi:hypothetical protein